jgi:hypothetical protein
MSRTYRNIPHSYFRNPKGKKQALINGVRKKAVPPDSWDDIPFNKEVWTVTRVINEMEGRFTEAEIIQKIANKFKLSYKEAEKIVRDNNGE